MSYLFSSRKHGRKGVIVKIPVYPCVTYKASEPDSKPDKTNSNTPVSYKTIRAGSNWK